MQPINTCNNKNRICICRSKWVMGPVSNDKCLTKVDMWEIKLIYAFSIMGTWMPCQCSHTNNSERRTCGMKTSDIYIESNNVCEKCRILPVIFNLFILWLKLFHEHCIHKSKKTCNHWNLFYKMKFHKMD